MLNHQQRINRLFDASAQRWKDLYDEASLEGRIYQRRRSLALEWIDQLQLKSEARILEAGCGAGLLASHLAGRGYDVHCIDSSEAMVALADAEAKAATVPGRITVDLGDVHSLRFESGEFDLVVALGVLPFLHSPRLALMELARVTRSGGWLLLSSDNRFRLNRLLDPRFMPFPGRERLKRWLVRVRVKGEPRLPAELRSYKAVRGMVSDVGLTPDRSLSVGFGPFTMLGRHVLRDSTGIAVNSRLQALAEANVPGIRAVGAQHLILARKLPAGQ